MKAPNFKTEEDKLSGLLRESRAAPPVPPRFQENVWRRIESAEKRNAPLAGDNWLDAVTIWLPTYLATQFGYTITKSALWTSVTASGMVLGILAFGEFADRVGRRPAGF